MSNFRKNEATLWQKEVREKLTDLKNTLGIANVEWNDWEREFIHDMCVKLSHDIINISVKQYEKVWDLWDRI